MIDTFRRHPVFVPPQAPVRVLSFAKCKYVLVGVVNTRDGSNAHTLAISMECPTSSISGNSLYGRAWSTGYAIVDQFGVGLVSKSGEIVFEKSFGWFPENPPPLSAAQKQAVREAFLRRRFVPQPEKG
jgi:hypothetical protein